MDGGGQSARRRRRAGAEVEAAGDVDTPLCFGYTPDVYRSTVVWFVRCACVLLIDRCVRY